MLGHDVGHDGANERELDDEGEDVWSRVLHGVAQHVRPELVAEALLVLGGVHLVEEIAVFDSMAVKFTLQPQTSILVTLKWLFKLFIWS